MRRRPSLDGTQLTPAIPGLLVLATAILLATSDGGYAAQSWYPVALFVLGLAAVVAAISAPGPRPPLLLVLALAAFAAYTAWAFLSMLWADVPAAAWDGANRDLLYLLALGIVATRPWTRLSSTVALGLLSGGLAVVAIVVLAATGSSNPGGSFLEGRLADPIGYANANAALWLLGFWPALHLAASPQLRWWLRGPALGAASLLVQMALLSQSRGAVFGFAVSAVVYLILTPRRWPGLLALLAVLAGVALSFDTLTGVRNAGSLEALRSAMGDARTAIAIGCLVLAAVGALAALAGRRTPESLRTPRARRYGNLALLALALAGVIAGLAVIWPVGSWLDDRWHDFKVSGYSQVDDGSTRFTGSLGSNRYDFWRVALDQFEAHPVTGIGADNFAVPYLEERRSPEAPQYPHSLAMGVLSQLGLVGTALLLAFLGLTAAAVLRVRAAARPGEAGLVAAAFAGFSAWFAHGLADWLWEFPALGMGALALLGLAARLALAPEDEPVEQPALEEWPRSRPPALIRVGAALVAVGAAISFALPGAAARVTRAASDVQSSDTPAALERFDKAAGLNPLRAEALISKAILARRVGRPADAAAALTEAVEREPNSWFAWFETALLATAQHNRRAAEDALRRAKLLNPRQPVIRDVEVAVRAGRPVDPDAAEAALSGQLRRKLQPTQIG